jgi:hypothetical protein
VEAGQRFRVGLREPADFPGADVGPVHAVALEAELVVHEPVPDVVRVRRSAEGRPLRGQPEAGQRWHDDREGVLRTTAVLRRFGQSPGQLGEF